MLKIKVDGSFLTPTTLLEQMAFVEDLHAEQREELISQQANEQLERTGIDAERRRASQQLEPNNAFHQQMMSQIESSGNGLQDSVILLDHRDAVDQNMQQEQIQPKGQNSFNI